MTGKRLNPIPLAAQKRTKSGRPGRLAFITEKVIEMWADGCDFDIWIRRSRLPTTSSKFPRNRIGSEISLVPPFFEALIVNRLKRPQPDRTTFETADQLPV